ncbi:MAG: superoxide dismutase [Thermoanaerobaculia bacterium]
MPFKTYKPKQFNLSGLNGISDETLEIHFKLYEGYVTNTNKLNERLADMVKGGRVDPDQMAPFSELKRRLGFEYNGMVLHEYYFENMKKQGGGEAGKGKFRDLVEGTYGDWATWKADFSAVGMMRGIGWAICYHDPAADHIVNVWCNEHQVNNIAGYTPLVVMDVWEHAFFRDYKPAEKGKYIEAFLSNVDWDAVEGRV